MHGHFHAKLRAPDKMHTETVFSTIFSSTLFITIVDRQAGCQ